MVGCWPVSGIWGNKDWVVIKMGDLSKSVATWKVCVATPLYMLHVDVTPTIKLLPRVENKLLNWLGFMVCL